MWLMATMTEADRSDSSRDGWPVQAESATELGRARDKSMKRSKMKMVRWTVLMLTLLLALAAQAVAQQPAGGDALVITAENRTAAEEANRGRPRADDRIRVGDRIRYTLTFTNPTAGPVGNVVLHNPLGEGLRFVGGSVTVRGGTARVEYSIDRGATYSAQPMIEVEENGRKVRRPAPPELYTDVRWTLETQVQPGARVVASYEARLTPETAAAVTAADNDTGRANRGGSQHN